MYAREPIGVDSNAFMDMGLSTTRMYSGSHQMFKRRIHVLVLTLYKRRKPTLWNSSHVITANIVRNTMR